MVLSADDRQLNENSTGSSYKNLKISITTKQQSSSDTIITVTTALSISCNLQHSCHVSATETAGMATNLYESALKANQ